MLIILNAENHLSGHVSGVHVVLSLWTAMDHVRAAGSVISWIGKQEPSGSGVDGSRRLGGREDGGGERGLGWR